MPLEMTQKCTIIESISHICLLLVMPLCMFPGKDGHLWRQLGSLGQREVKDAQLVAQAGGPSVSMSLICELTNADTFLTAQRTVFPDNSRLDHFSSARRINTFLTGWVSRLLMTMDFFPGKMGSVWGWGRMSCSCSSDTLLSIIIASQPLQILVCTPGCIPHQLQQCVWRWDPDSRNLLKLPR